MNRILIAGATGYLGQYVAREFKDQHYFTRVVARNPQKLEKAAIRANEVVIAELTDKASLANCCNNIDIVFSSVGITRQKDGLTYMDVDYQANLNLLEEAKSSGVKKFMYVSVLHGDKLRQLKLCEAKEKFVDALKNSGMDYCIIRPGAYYSDMGEFYEMAKRGRIILFGKENHKMNPIDGEDLAKICVKAASSKEKEIAAGGPEILTHDQIAAIAFTVSGKKKKIMHIPGWLTRVLLFLLRTFTSSKIYGPVEFLITVLSIDMIAPEYGSHTLKAYFEKLKSK